MTEPTPVAADDKLEELRWYLEQSTPSVTYYGEDISPEGDVYRVTSDENATFVAHFKSKDDAMFFLYARSAVPRLLAGVAGADAKAHGCGANGAPG